MSTSQGNGVSAGPVPPPTSTQLFVDGAWRDAADGATFAVISPTSEATLATVAAAGAADVDAAVRAARRQVDSTSSATSPPGPTRSRVARCHRLAAQLRAGGVWINGPGTPDARLPWGGLKASGIGRELRFAGIEGTTEEKTVTITF
jgi:acyl-CoA reductase-like NAD-dependent aldehyde dehydrogenase